MFNSIIRSSKVTQKLCIPFYILLLLLKVINIRLSKYFEFVKEINFFIEESLRELDFDGSSRPGKTLRLKEHAHIIHQRGPYIGFKINVI